MADLLNNSEGAIRTSEALLRANGGRSVRLRIAGPANAGDVAEELGLATPEFQDVELGPAVFRRLESAGRLLVSSRAVEQAAGTVQVASAVALLAGAVGVVIDDVIYGIERVNSEQAAGEPFCYVLSLRAPLA